jgi:hypothetical protein
MSDLVEKFILYEIASGKVLYSGTSCSPEGLAQQGQSVIVGTQCDLMQNFIDGGIVVPIPPKPSPHHTFNYTTKQWEDPRTLADLKAAQWGLIKQARSQAEYAGFTWDGSTFDSDAISQNRITGAVTLAQMSSTFSIDWVLADNTVRTLNQSDMLAVGAALGAHVAAIFAKGVLLREQIEAATTAEEVAGVVW